MEYNKSLSARIRRRNNKGFAGLSNKFVATRDGELISYTSLKASKMGDYSDPKQNHKDKDYELDKRRKQKLGFRAREYKFDASGNLMYKANVHKIMSKRFADNHQKL